MAQKQEQKSYLTEAISAWSPWGSRSPTPKSEQDAEKETNKPGRRTVSVDGSSPSSSNLAADVGISSAARKAADHTVSHWHTLTAKSYPPDCPELIIQWYHAVDVALRSPKYINHDPATSSDQKPAPTPKKWMAFSSRDSNAIEKAFQKLAEEERAKDSESASNSSENNQQTSPDPLRLRPNRSIDNERPNPRSAKVPVNEDYLFDVDIENRELGPAYWLGPVYTVRRGTWFFVEGTTLKPCDETLAYQLEEGYLKTKPWKMTKADPLSSQSNDQTDTSTISQKSDASEADSPKTKETRQSSPELLTYRLFGAHMNSIVTYEDQTTAWLVSDDFLSRMSSSVYQRFAGGAHLSGTKVLRGYQDLSKKKIAANDGKKSTASSNLAEKDSVNSGETSQIHLPQSQSNSSETTQSTHGVDPSDDQVVHKDKQEPESQRSFLERQMSNLVASAYKPDPETQDEEARKRAETEIRDDYRNISNDDQDREVDHLILVTHGVGQRLGARFETFNFIHDVNQFRKTIKKVYNDSEDLQALNGEIEKSDKNCRIQVLPICWRHLLDFPHSSSKGKKHEQDLSDTIADEDPEYPSLDDITVDGVPALRGILIDIVLDVLLYQTPSYRDHISKAVVKECNRILGLFKQRNPRFKGKVSLFGHSLGSAVYFDLLSMQSDDKAVFEKFAKRHVLANKDFEFDFDVENLVCVGSPIGLFQMLNGKTISSRTVSRQVTLDGSKDGIEDPFDERSVSKSTNNSKQANFWDEIRTSSPKCRQLYNIFHPTDPVAYRMEPLISPSMASLQAQNLPYTKGGFLGAPIGHGITGIPAKVGQSVSDLWTSFSSGIANSFINRSLGITAEDVAKMNAPAPASAHQSRPPSQGYFQSQPPGYYQVQSPGAGTGITAGGVIPEEYSSPITSPTPMDDSRKRQLASEAAEAQKSGAHPPTLIDSELETLFSGFQNRQEVGEENPKTAPPSSPRATERATKERTLKLKREEAKVRALNSNGRVDYSIQEGVFDISFLQSIASHLTYWTDEDVSHFLVSQLLAQQLVDGNKRQGPR